MVRYAEDNFEAEARNIRREGAESEGGGGVLSTAGLSMASNESSSSRSGNDDDEEEEEDEGWGSSLARSNVDSKKTSLGATHGTVRLICV
jgi:hypothetical protein